MYEVVIPTDLRGGEPGGEAGGDVHRAVVAGSRCSSSSELSALALSSGGIGLLRPDELVELAGVAECSRRRPAQQPSSRHADHQCAQLGCVDDVG